MAKFQSLKGFRDFLPEDMAVQNYIFDVWREACELFGYDEYNGPLLEYAEIYKKSGEELGSSGKELYKFKDAGDREIVLRPEMTPTVSRMISQYASSLPKPIRWFSIGQFFRAEKPQKGRLREHYQLNADIFGSNSILADYEVISLSITILRKLGAKDNMFIVKVNNRKFVDSYMENIIGIKDEAVKTKLMRLIDASPKYSKMWLKTQVEEIADKSVYAKVEDYLKLNFEDLLTKIELPEVDELVDLINLLYKTYPESVIFDPSIARGFDYYTGMVFEVFDRKPDNNRSLFGGGRYDNLLSLFDKKSMPAVGFGQGDVTLKIFLENWGLLPKYQDKSVEVLVTVFNKESTYYSLKLFNYLKDSNISTQLYLNTQDSISKQLDYANKNNIKIALIAGENEVKDNSVTLKDMDSGKQEIVKIDDLVNKLKSLL